MGGNKNYYLIALNFKFGRVHTSINHCKLCTKKTRENDVYICLNHEC